MKNRWLNDYENNITSQHGEDGVLAKILEIIPDCSNWCVEFGAWDGKLLSNTWNLTNNLNWSTILIEANSTKYSLLKELYTNKSTVYPINAFVGTHGKQKLDNIFSKTPLPKDFDVLSIDIDGNDYNVWRALQNYKPKVVIIEFNPTIPNEIVYIQKDDPKLYHGSSLLAMVNLGKEKGYELVAATRNNAFFVIQKYFELFNISNNSLCFMYPYNPDVHLKIFQLYDGTIKLHGNSTLRWAGKYKIEENKIQLIPKFIRKWKSKRNKPLYIKLLAYLHQKLFGNK